MFTNTVLHWSLSGWSHLSSQWTICKHFLQDCHLDRTWFWSLKLTFVCQKLASTGYPKHHLYIYEKSHCCGVCCCCWSSENRSFWSCRSLTNRVSVFVLSCGCPTKRWPEIWHKTVVENEWSGVTQTSSRRLCYVEVIFVFVFQRNHFIDSLSSGSVQHYKMWYSHNIYIKMWQLT